MNHHPTTLAAFAVRVAEKHDPLLVDYGPDEQADRATEALTRFTTTTPLAPVADTVIDLAGFGKAPVHFTSGEHQYVLLSEVAEQLGMPLHKAHKWAETEQGWFVRDQREEDERRGDGCLGYTLMRYLVDLDLCLSQDDPEARPDGGGKRWSTAGDWLVAQDRLPSLLLSSPWSKEFMGNTMDAMAHAFRRQFGDRLKDIPTYGPDGLPTGTSAADTLFRSNLTEDEALRRAVRGPALDPDDTDRGQ